MARQLRFQYPGAVYHVMARGDGGKPLFIGKEDHESFVYWLEWVCVSHGWRVHAWVLMGNHFNFGEESFNDKAQAKIRKPGNHAGGAVRAPSEKEAERIIAAVGSALGMPTALDELMRLRKDDANKGICAVLAKRHTAVGNEWLGRRLAMGHRPM